MSSCHVVADAAPAAAAATAERSTDSPAPCRPPLQEAEVASQTPNDSSTATAKKKMKQQQQQQQRGSGSKVPTAEEIEAKRAARAAKRELEERKRSEREGRAQANLLGQATGPPGGVEGRADGGTEASNGTAAAVWTDDEGQPLFEPRVWKRVRGCEDVRGTRLRVGSWNILAQGLVRRKLFPGSDALKWKDREAGLSSELVAHGWDVAALQEVDRVESHAKTLAGAGYSHHYQKGFASKQHGLMIAWRSDAERARRLGRPFFEAEPVATRTFYYDRLELSSGALDEGAQGAPPPVARIGSSRITRNIGLGVAIRFAGHEEEGEGAESSTTAAPRRRRPRRPRGLIVGTTHTWWHPLYAYERARQAALLVRELRRFQRQRDAEWYGWPVVLAGDFNDQPHSATYHMLTGRAPTAHCRDEVRESHVVHKSIAEHAALTAARTHRDAEASRRGDAIRAGATAGGTLAADDEVIQEDEGEEEEQDEEGATGQEKAAAGDDQLRRNCRSATPADGLLDLDALTRVMRGLDPADQIDDVDAARRLAAPLRSCYAEAYDRLEPPEEDNFFGSPSRGRERYDDESWRAESANPHLGFDAPEPMWTLFSPLFSLTLDYIFLFPLVASTPAVPTGSEEEEDGAEPRGGTTRPSDEGVNDEDSVGGAPAYPRVTALLPTHKTRVFERRGALPRRTVCASDHVALGAEIELPDSW